MEKDEIKEDIVKFRETLFLKCGVNCFYFYGNKEPCSHRKDEECKISVRDAYSTLRNQKKIDLVLS